MTVTLVDGKYNVRASLELAEKVERIGLGIEQYMEKANLSPGDERWIRKTIGGIAESIRESVTRAERADEDIPIPEKVYQGAWSEMEQNRLKAQLRATYRDYRPWVFYQASFFRDCNRLVTRSAFTADGSSLRARRQIAAFAAVLSKLLGGVDIAPNR